MPTRSLEEIYKRYEFNKTEPETLVGLIDSVIKKSDSIKANFKRYRELVGDIYQIMMREDFLRTIVLSTDDNEHKQILGIGIDGSFQCVGGIGGIWYTPISVASIIFKGGLGSDPKVSVAADIHDINQLEYLNVEKEASFRMLAGETKAIKDGITKLGSAQKGVIFIDGPIVDPPWVSSEKSYQEYVKDRCEAIERCIDRNLLLIGCVKRIMGRSLINHVTNELAENDVERERTKQFISDMHLITYVFTKLSFEVDRGVFYSSPIDVSEIDEAHKSYLDEGIRVYSIFMQKDPYSRPIRLDVPFKSETSEDVEAKAVEAVKITSLWCYPGQDVPIPVMLAHDKCNVRKGCAEVLYEEMITRTTTNELFDNIVKTKLG